MMNLAVVDDSREDREQLCAMLEHYCTTRGIQAELTCFSSGDELLASFVPGHFQCMLLDIYMEGTDGMETAREVYRRDPACRLIFSTVSISHAVSSYEVRAAWYLTKPYSIRRLADAMDAACRDLLHYGKSLFLHVSGQAMQVRLGDIYFIDCTDRQARLHLRERTLEVDEPVSELVARLSADPRFMICNRSTMVNLDQIELAEEHDFRMKNGVCVPLRQRGRAALKKAFLAWTLQELRREVRI